MRGELIITRKRDGWKVFAVIYKGKAKLYTDGLRDITDKLPHLKKELEEMRLPSKTVLVSEAVANNHDADHRGTVASVLGSNPERAVELQKTVGLIGMAIFDIVFYDGEQLVGVRSYEYRLDIIQDMMMHHHTRLDVARHIESVEILSMSFDGAKNVALEHDWEGLVCSAKGFTSSFRLDGKSPQRIRECFKWKPIHEDDFIVREVILREKDPTSAKELVLLQVDPVTKKEFLCGKLGTFSNAVRKELAQLARPFVVQVRFETRHESGKLCNPAFMHIRTDKKLRDCVAPKSFEGGR